MALADDSAVAEFVRIKAGYGVRLYEIWFESGALAPREVGTDYDGVILDAEANHGEWAITVRFLERKNISKATADLRSRQSPVSVKYIQESCETSEAVHPFTNRQFEALETAFELVYFEVPKDATLDGVAKELDISSQALSETLRRTCRGIFATVFGSQSASARPRELFELRVARSTRRRRERTVPFYRENEMSGLTSAFGLPSLRRGAPSLGKKSL